MPKTKWLFTTMQKLIIKNSKKCYAHFETAWFPENQVPIYLCTLQPNTNTLRQKRSNRLTLVAGTINKIEKLNKGR